MFKFELEKVNKIISRLHKSGQLKGKKIHLFGVSDSSRQIIQSLRELGHEPMSVIDNDPVKQGSFCSRVMVVPISAVEKNNDTLILIYSRFWREMQSQALSAGFCAWQIIILMDKGKSVVGLFYECWQGRKIFRRIKDKYGDVPMFLCPYTGTGDVYLIGAFWDEYISKNDIKNYVFLVINGACGSVASLFGIRNVELLENQKESSLLIRYYTLCPTEINLKVLNDGWLQIKANPTEWFRGYKGLYFNELFRKFVFGLPDSSKPRHPKFSDVSDQLNSLFEENRLIEKKTALLSPYSNTLADLPDSFWEKITDVLVERGYTVCTNSSGKHEPAVRGSVPIFFSLNIAPQFVEMAGTFIGVRSGFCDVVSGANAKKIILYDAEDRFYNCSAYEYFSLRRMGLSDDVVEIEYHHDNSEETLVTEIMENLRFIG